jgi:hypothetical protein
VFFPANKHMRFNQQKKTKNPHLQFSSFFSEIPSKLVYVVALLTCIRVELGLYLSRDKVCVDFCDFSQFLYANADIETLTSS